MIPDDPIEALKEKIRDLNEKVINGDYYAARYALPDAQEFCDITKRQIKAGTVLSVRILPFIDYGDQIGFQYEIRMDDSLISGSHTPRAK